MTASLDHPTRSGLSIHAKTSRQSSTLVHRFNLCHDLLDRTHANPTALACLFVWLRFSALRQLTWQRRHNTKPRKLAHAQDRLTQKLARRDLRPAPAPIFVQRAFAVWTPISTPRSVESLPAGGTGRELDLI